MPRVILAGAGITLNHWPEYDPIEPGRPASSSGSSYWVRLDESARWFDDETGLRATANQIMEVLSDVSQLKIRTGGNGFSWIDSVSLGSQTQPPRDTPAASTFDDSDEGWRLAGGAFGLITRPTHDAANGVVSAMNTGFARWRSPSTFRGNFSNFFGKSLVLDEAWDRPGGPANIRNLGRVIIFGGGFKIWAFFGSDPESTFKSFALRLDETQSWNISADNDRATRDQIIAVLTNLQRVEILTGGGAGLLDRVVLGAD